MLSLQTPYMYLLLDICHWHVEGNQLSNTIYVKIVKVAIEYGQLHANASWAQASHSFGSAPCNNYQLEASSGGGRADQDE
jgi:hypothetical protein